MGVTTIYKATYSGVPVFEMPCRGVAVMRRRSDSWLNATQILKVAGFDKPQRTRVLEREIQKGVHEKIQGGYGKYQGTWVPLDRGISLAKQYEVDHLLAPLFDFQPSLNESPPLAPKHSTAPPARSRAPRSRASTSARLEQPVPSNTGLRGRNTNNSWSNFESDAERNLLPAPSSRESNAKISTQSKLARSSNLLRARAKAINSKSDHTASASTQTRASDRTSKQPVDLENSPSLTPSELSPTSRASSSAEDLSVSFNTKVAKPTRNKTISQRSPDFHPEETQSSGRGQKRKHDSSLDESPESSDGAEYQYLNAYPSTITLTKHAQILLKYFVSKSKRIPSILTDPPSDFDPNLHLDDEGHTPLHWSCALGLMHIISLLLNCGASTDRANFSGQTPLMRAVMFKNNYDSRTFPQILEWSSQSIGHADHKGRTVLHYISDTALSKGKFPAAQYYLELILDHLTSYPNAKFNIINFQDNEGETAFTIAARCHNQSFAKILLDHGANPIKAPRSVKVAEHHIALENDDQDLSPTSFSSRPAHQLDPNSPRNSPHSSSRSDLYQFVDSTASHGNFIPTDHLNRSELRCSETAQRVKNVILPEVNSMMEYLEAAFDAEYQDKERDLGHANGLLSQIEKEYSEGQGKILSYEKILSDFQEKKSALEELEMELNEKLRKRYRFGWEKYVRDEQEREMRFKEQQKQYLQQLSIEDRSFLDTENVKFDDSSQQEILMKLLEDERENSDLLSVMKIPATDTKVECDLLRESVKKLTDEREQLFKEFINLSSENAVGENEKDDLEEENNWNVKASRLNNYRKLISLGCGGIGLDEVDEVIESLNEGIDASELEEYYRPERVEAQGSSNADRFDPLFTASQNHQTPFPTDSTQGHHSNHALNQSAPRPSIQHIFKQ